MNGGAAGACGDAGLAQDGDGLALLQGSLDAAQLLGILAGTGLLDVEDAAWQRAPADPDLWAPLVREKGRVRLERFL